MIEKFGSAYKVVNDELFCTLGFIPTPSELETMPEDELWGAVESFYPEVVKEVNEYFNTSFEANIVEERVEAEVVLNNVGITFEEIEPWDDDNETLKYLMIYNNKVAGFVVATGHPMNPIEFEISSEEALSGAMAKMLIFVKDDTVDMSLLAEVNEVDSKMVLNVEDEEVGSYENNIFTTTDCEALGRFINEIRYGFAIK